MKHMILLCLVSGGLFLTTPSQGQIGTDSQIKPQETGVLGHLSPDLLSKIRALAILVEKKQAEGQITDATLQRELQGGDPGAVIRGLGPDANQLLEEIKASLQSSYSEESLSVLLQALIGTAP
jgi:hypothetical protein